MNLKWIIIGAVAVMLLIAFGRNPVEQSRERRAEAKRGKDPLMLAIDKHNKDQKTSHSTRGSIGRSAPPEGAERVAPPPQREYQGSTRRGAPGTAYPGTAAPAQPAAAPAGGGYYPPPPEAAGAMQNRTPPNLGPRGERMFDLPDGRKFAFYGTQMFAVDENGNRSLLPDGDYAVFDGKIIITVRGGERVGFGANKGS